MVRSVFIVILLFLFFPNLPIFSQNIFKEIFALSPPQESKIDFPVFVPPVAPETILSKKDQVISSGHIADSYYYYSRLSGDEIFSFYNNIFLQQGLHFVNKLDQQGNISFTYKRGAIVQAILTIAERYPGHYKEYPNQTPFIISWNEAYEAFVLPQNSGRAKPRKDIAVYPYAYALNNKKSSEADNAVYLTKNPATEVVAYYKDHMGDFDWRFKAEFPLSGRYNIYEAITLNTGIAELLSSNGMNMTAIFPGVDVTLTGATLAYNRGEENCHILILQLKDSPQQLRRSRINPEPFEKYGRTMIILGKEDPGQRALAEQSLPNLKKAFNEAFGSMGGQDAQPGAIQSQEENIFKDSTQPDQKDSVPVNGQSRFGSDVQYIPFDAQYQINPQE